MPPIPERELRPTMQVAFGVLIGMWLFTITITIGAVVLAFWLGS